MMWMFTVLAAAFVGKTLAKMVVKKRPVFTYRCKGCGEYITVIDMGLMTAPCCPACNEIAGRAFDENSTYLHARAQRKVEMKLQTVAAITAGAAAGFLYGFLF